MQQRLKGLIQQAKYRYNLFLAALCVFWFLKMTARQVQCFTAYAVKLLPTVAFAFVYQINVVLYEYVVSAFDMPCPIRLCCAPNRSVLL